MRLIPHLFIAVLLLVAGPACTSAHAREVVPLNRAWSFTFGDPAGAADPASPARDWQAIHLPHSFSTPYFLGTGFYVGYGWYRKHLEVSPAWRGKRVALEFDGVFQDAEIYVNGKQAGRHRGGYTGFTIDLTPHLRPGANMLAVRVNNLWNARLAPRAGEHVFSGGIYRDVRLVLTDPVHVSWYGTFVTTPEVSAQRARVRVQTEVENHTGAAQEVTLVSRVFDPAGRQVARATTRRTIEPGVATAIEQDGLSVANPALWDPDRPAMYRLRSEVLVGGRRVDDYRTPFGIRTIQWTADKGFFLNGKHLYLRGANVHQDHAGWGDAVTQAAARRDVKMIKDAGFNFIRGSHYPHAPAFSRATDELGVLFWSEAPFWGIGWFGGDGHWFSSAYPPKAEDRPEFEASVLAQTAEMIRIHRNHPSIITWSNGNEVFFTTPSAGDAMRDFVRRQVEFMRKLDPTRPIAVGGSQRGNVDRLGDIAGYNGDGAAMPEYQNPGVPNMVSEYGTNMSVRPGKFEPGWGDLLNTPGIRQEDGPTPWRLPWRSGEAIWAGFDHGSIASVEFGSMGMIDYFRIPKRQYYWYRKEYAGVAPPRWPVPGTAHRLALSADKTRIEGTQGHDDVQLLVTVHDRQGQALSNSPEVTLTVERGPGEFPTGRSITFKPDSMIAIRDGQAAIAFRSYHAGTSVIRASSPGLQPARIEISTRGPDRWVEGKSIQAPDRPVRAFLPFVRLDDDGSSGNLLANRPTRASSAAAGHSSRLATDENAETWWQAADAGPDAAWSADLENIYQLSRVEFAPQLQSPLKFVLEGSLDRERWDHIASGGGAQQNYVIEKLEGSRKARFLRIRFVELPAGQHASLAEVRAFGVPARD
jgi:beta-galactosidase